MPENSVRVDLGTTGELQRIFKWSPNVAAAPDNTAALVDAIQHAFNQTLLRDLKPGSWAQVYCDNIYAWDPDARLALNVTSPNRRTTRYATMIPHFIAAMQAGAKEYELSVPALDAQKAKLIEQHKDDKYPWTADDLATFYLPPFGLAMAETDSIQLLHYPPTSTLTYMDYLYSPTNRRWETLLSQNGWPGDKNTLLETIVDICPIAASGGSKGGAVIEPVIENFHDYVVQMLGVLLRKSDSGKRTQPLVAYGGPVGDWLVANYLDQMQAQGVNIPDYKGEPGRPTVAQTFFLKLLGDDGPETPVMTANHPIKFNYYDGDLKDAEEQKRKDVDAGVQSKPVQETDTQDLIYLQQDLVAAGWQAAMGADWRDDPDPKQVLEEMMDKWTDQSDPSFERVLAIFHEQVQQYAMEPLPYTQTKAWWVQLKAAAPAAAPPWN